MHSSTTRVTRRPLAGLAALLTGLVTVLVVPPPSAEAALGDKPLITYNMQGATTGDDSKWTTTIAGYAARAEIVALQEAGPTPPPLTPGTQAGQINIPGLPQIGRAGYVQHTSWRGGQGNYDVYFLQTDSTGGTYVGGRTNIAMVTQRAADEVTAVPNPAGRAALGVRYDDTWYFTLHARASGNQNEADAMVAQIALTVAARGRNERWTILGDFNRPPGDLTVPAGAHIYRSGQPTQQSGNELDYLVSSENVSGIQVNRLAGATSDHYAVALGTLRASAEPIDRYGRDRTVVNVEAGGVLDADHGRTERDTDIVSWHRNGEPNQAWTLKHYLDNTIQFRGRGSGRCIDIYYSDSAEDGRKLVLWDCTGQASQRWIPESVGYGEMRLRSVVRPELCMATSGRGDSKPYESKIKVLHCSDASSQRWLFTPAEATTTVLDGLLFDAQAHPVKSVVESMRSGGVLNVDGSGIDTRIVSRNRTGVANQGWKLEWSHGNNVSFRGIDSNRCIDIYYSDSAVNGRELVLWHCTGQASQRWRPVMLDNGQMLLQSVLKPELCMDIYRGSSAPNEGYLVVWGCNTIFANQQWILTPYNPGSGPEHQHPHDDL
ncbi:RICIN domain-containing protein [Micromonospora rubida]|uniref:RICIN domain-containing protein n=1 Tax=Micromonospora rubida TaxID=2697657 RepID=UPI00137835B4|nr:RICIN domain-containing protein [Micromonospora rubida]NBE82409.1 hypothetical protein [Micromonospora rubida]